MIGIQFENNEQRSIVYFSHGGKNLYKAERFADFLRSYSHASITKVSATQISFNNDAGDGIGSVFVSAKLFLREVKSQSVFAIIIPAPVDGMLNADQEVPDDVGQRIAAEYSNLAGETFVFLHGALVGDSV